MSPKKRPTKTSAKGATAAIPAKAPAKAKATTKSALGAKSASGKTANGKTANGKSVGSKVTAPPTKTKTATTRPISAGKSGKGKVAEIKPSRSKAASEKGAASDKATARRVSSVSAPRGKTADPKSKPTKTGGKKSAAAPKKSTLGATVKKPTMTRTASKRSATPAGTQETLTTKSQRPPKDNARLTAVKKTASPLSEKMSEAHRVGATPKPKPPKTLRESSTSSRPLRKESEASGAEFEKFRQLLLSVRHRLIGDVNMMSQEALGGSDGAADNHAPIHPAEVGTHSFEQEFTLNLLSSDGDRLDRIEAALEKIADRTYGSCDECGGRIPRARLEVIPDTPFCVKCATRLEV